jgi:predicted nucleic acid-binding protein
VIVYADTSAVVKLFVIERDSDVTQSILKKARAVGTALVTLAELVATLARSERMGVLSADDAVADRAGLAAFWPSLVHIGIDAALVARAEVLAWEHVLRGYDAIHLAAARIWQERVESPVTVATFDQEVWEAARQSGLIASP